MADHHIQAGGGCNFRLQENECFSACCDPLYSFQLNSSPLYSHTLPAKVGHWFHNWMSTHLLIFRFGWCRIRSIYRKILRPDGQELIYWSKVACILPIITAIANQRQVYLWVQDQSYSTSLWHFSKLILSVYWGEHPGHDLLFSLHTNPSTLVWGLWV